MTESGYATVSAKIAAIVREQLQAGKTAPRRPGHNAPILLRFPS
jgi:hypothetical protein